MKLLRYVLPFALATCGVAMPGFADDTYTSDGYSTTVDQRERDFAAVSDFVKSKRATTLADKGGNFNISGTVETSWDHIRTKTDGKRQRGRSSSHLTPPEKPHAPFATNYFEVEANLVFDYRTDRTWATIQLQLSNPCGIRDKDLEYTGSDKHRNRNYLWGSGKLNNIALRKAFLGYNVFEQGTQRFDVEVGRRRLYDVYDSQVEFNNYFDGITLRYLNSFEGVTDFSLKASAFVIDQTVNHFGWVGEAGFLNIADTGLGFKYSLIKWKKGGYNRYHKKHPMGSRFLVSQYLLNYTFTPDYVRMKTNVYGAYLNNAEGKKNHFSNHKKANDGWYAGVTVGEIKKQGDYAFDVNYQWVQAQCVPESDVSGTLGRDNPRELSFYGYREGGFANYKGWKVTGTYALTDNLNLEAFYQDVRQQSHKIGGSHRSHYFQLQATYAF